MRLIGMGENCTLNDDELSVEGGAWRVYEFPGLVSKRAADITLDRITCSRILGRHMQAQFVDAGQHVLSGEVLLPRFGPPVEAAFRRFVVNTLETQGKPQG